MRHYFTNCLLGIVAFACLSPAVAVDTDWLAAQRQADGSFQTAGDIATPFQSTAEALRTLNIVDGAVSADTALPFINGTAFEGTEYLARKIMVNAESGNDVSALVERLLEHQNNDGGFGQRAGYNSSVPGTAFALEALAIAGRESSPAAGPAIGFLQTAQQADGSWRLPNNGASVYLTAVAMRAVWHYRHRFALDETLAQARDYLLSRRDGTGLWGQTFETALALIAIAPMMIDRSQIDNSLQSLRRQQLVDGSFAGDVYQTALALRALRLAELPAPDEIRLSGRVIDGDTGRALSGVTASLEGASTRQVVTDGNGRFLLPRLVAGNYRLTLMLPTYHTLAANMSLQTGQQQDLGDVNLLKETVEPINGTVLGTVTRADNGLPVPGARVSVTGMSGSATTDADGRYQLSNVPTGDVEIRAAAPDFATASVSGNVTAGNILVFSPALELLSAVQVTVEGMITDRETGQPLAGVSVDVASLGGNFTATTDSTGRYRLAGLQPGPRTLSASLAGYQTATGSTTAAKNVVINFSPALVPVGDIAEPQNNSLIMGTVVNRLTGQALAGVQVAWVGAHGSGNTATDADGRFLFEGLAPDTYRLEFTLAGYQSLAAEFELPESVQLDLGEVGLLEETVQQTAALHGAVVDSRTNKPLQGVEIAAEFPSGNLNTTTNSAGEFELTGIADEDGVLRFTLDGYTKVEYGVHLVFGETLELNQIRMRPEEVVELLPDLKVGGLDAGGINTDLNTLRVSGSLEVTLKNVGNSEAAHPFEILAFYDRNKSGHYEKGIDASLAETTVETPLAVEQEMTLSLALSGSAEYRDEPVTVWVDDAEELVESSEANNIASSTINCRREPEPLSPSPPKVKWHWSGSTVAPSYNQVMSTPIVAQLNDDNDDNVIDARDIPDVIFATFTGKAYNDLGVIRAVSGADGSEVWDPSIPVPRGSASYGPAAGDIDNDGRVEIVTGSAQFIDRFLSVYGNDGLLKWRVPTTRLAQPVLADLDGDGQVEILFGGAVFSASGQLLWEGRGDTMPIAVDLDLDGQLEVLASGNAYESDGTEKWSSGLGPGSFGGGYAIGNFDGDDYPEIVTKSNDSSIVLLEHTGEIKWGPVSIPGEGGGPPTIADMDGDGKPEIGVAGARFYTVFETDGSIKWSSPTQDLSSARTGSSVFDFEGDGKAEILYNDELFFRIYDGSTGDVLFEIPNPSGTLFENPIVVDVDNDNHAEIVLAANNYRFKGVTGIRVFESSRDDWVATRNIWNQHAYHIDNINDDGTIPQFEAPSWLTHNTYRLNTFADRNALDEPDLTVSRLAVVDHGPGQPFSMHARYGNAGAIANGSGTAVRFYNGDPLSGGILLGTQTLPVIQGRDFVDLQLDGITGISAGDEIFAVVDSENRSAECREDNNRMSIIVTGILGRLQLSLNDAVFPPNSDIGITGTVTNPGSLAAGYRLETRVEDAAGSLVFSLPSKAIDLLPGGGSTNVGQVWNTGLTLAGDYRVVGILLDAQGNVLDQDSAAFRISETVNGLPIARLRTTTDRHQYHTTDTVQIHDLVQNVSTNTLIDDASLQLTVTGPATSTIFTTTFDVGSLASGNLRELRMPLALNAVAEGDYRVAAELRDGGGVLLAVDEAGFEVVENPALSLKGDVQAQLPELFIGETQVCNYTVSNTGTLNLQAQELFQVLANVTEATEVDAQPSIRDLPAGSQTSLIQSLATRGLTAGDYACVLQATVNGERLSLAHDVFRLKRPPINLNVTFTLGDRGRLLVLLDAIQPKDELHPPQRAYLEELLTQAGWSYTLVDSADAFTGEFRSGAYNIYALFDEHIKLDNQVAKELREAVWRGEGLLIAGAHDNRNYHVYEAAGVKLNGKLPHTPGMQLTQNDLGITGALSFAGSDKPLNITVQGAVTLGEYQDAKPSPAVTRYDYGDGITVLAGFDLLREAYRHAQADATDTFAGELLLAALDHVQPPVGEPVSSGMIPVHFTLQNQGIATPGRVLFTLPSDARLLDASQPIQQNGNLLEWRFDLQQDRQADITLWLQVAGQADGLVIDAQIQTGMAPDYLDYDTVQRVFQIEPRTMIEAVIGELQTYSDDNVIKQALHSVEKARDWINAGNIDKALQDLIQAADKLMQSAHPEAANLRRKLAELTRQTAQRF